MAMTLRMRLIEVDNAIDAVIQNLKNGVGITKYTIDNVSVEKQTSKELLNDLYEIRARIIKNSRPARNEVRYQF